MKVVANFIAFQIGWFSCILGAANGLPWFGPIVCLVLITLHLRMVDFPRRELQLILSAIGIGVILDSFFVITGWLNYPNGILLTGTAPYWIVALWAIFASTLNVSMKWLHGKYFLAALLGAIGGPLSYLAGARLGAVHIVDPLPALMALGVGWGLAMPILVLLARKFSENFDSKINTMEHADA